MNRGSCNCQTRANAGQRGVEVIGEVAMEAARPFFADTVQPTSRRFQLMRAHITSFHWALQDLNAQKVGTVPPSLPQVHPNT